MELMKPPSPNTNELITSEPIYGFIGKFHRVTFFTSCAYLSAETQTVDSLSLLSLGLSYFRPLVMFLMEP